jgi:membrane associated rhomboid family serine protease
LIFGDNVRPDGHGRFLAFYLASGVVAGLAHVALATGSSLPTIGASGAIAGVLGAYLVLFPSARVLTLVPLVFLPWLMEIPAFIYLGIWFLSQLSSALMTLGAAGDFGGIAWWAHIGGFAFGAPAAGSSPRRCGRGPVPSTYDPVLPIEDSNVMSDRIVTDTGCP